MMDPEYDRPNTNANCGTRSPATTLDEYAAALNTKRPEPPLHERVIQLEQQMRDVPKMIADLQEQIRALRVRTYGN